MSLGNLAVTVLSEIRMIRSFFVSWEVRILMMRSMWLGLTFLFLCARDDELIPTMTCRVAVIVCCGSISFLGADWRYVDFE